MCFPPAQPDVAQKNQISVCPGDPAAWLTLTRGPAVIPGARSSGRSPLIFVIFARFEFELIKQSRGFKRSGLPANVGNR